MYFMSGYYTPRKTYGLYIPGSPTPFKVSPTAYFVYCNGRTDREAFDGKLEFDIVLIPYEGNTDWVEPTVDALHQCLNANTIPHPRDDCDFCRYRAVASQYDQT